MALSRESCFNCSTFCFLLMRHLAAARLFISNNRARLMSSGGSARPELSAVLGEVLRMDFRIRLDVEDWDAGAKSDPACSLLTRDRLRFSGRLYL